MRRIVEEEKKKVYFREGKTSSYHIKQYAMIVTYCHFCLRLVFTRVGWVCIETKYFYGKGERRHHGLTLVFLVNIPKIGTKYH